MKKKIKSIKLKTSDKKLNISDVIKSGDCCDNPSYAGTKQFDICSNCGHMKTPPVL